MWSKRASELLDIARISKPNWHTPLSGCWEAPSDFGLLVAQNLSSNKNILAIWEHFLSNYPLPPNSWRWAPATGDTSTVHGCTISTQRLDNYYQLSNTARCWTMALASTDYRSDIPSLLTILTCCNNFNRVFNFQCTVWLTTKSEHDYMPLCNR